MLCALVGNSSERSVHPGWLGVHSCRDAEMRSRRSDGVGSATVVRAATPAWRHSPRSSIWSAMVSATSPPHAAAPSSEVAAFIWSPVRRNLRQAWAISQNVQDKTVLWIMGPTGGKNDVALRRQLLESGIAINMQDTFEVCQMRYGPLSFPVRCEEINHCRRSRSAPWPFLAGIDPKASRLGAPTSRIKHRNGRVVGKEIIRCKYGCAELLVQGFQPPASPTHPSGKG